MNEPAETTAESAEPAPFVPPDPEKKRPRALPEQVQTLSFANSVPRIVWAAAGVEIEDLRYIEYWSALPKRDKFLFGDRIEVRANDRSWRVELTVLAVTPVGLQVHFDKVTQFKTFAEPDDDDGTYTIRNEGGPSPYVIIRNRDGQPMSNRRYATKDIARMERGRLYPKRS